MGERNSAVAVLAALPLQSAGNFSKPDLNLCLRTYGKFSCGLADSCKTANGRDRRSLEARLISQIVAEQHI
jgi:hypothetical protein